MGTSHRNHCPKCLWSKHVDKDRPGDRKSKCQGGMKPVGLTFKKEGFDKYTGEPKQGELMVIHECVECDKISINRIAADDQPRTILKTHRETSKLETSKRSRIESQGIRLLDQDDTPEIQTQLFGKGNNPNHPNW